MVNKPDDAALAAVVRGLLEDRGWSRRELARRTGIGPSPLQYKLAGTSRFDYRDLVAIAEAFGLHSSELARRVEDHVTHSRENDRETT